MSTDELSPLPSSSGRGGWFSSDRSVTQSPPEKEERRGGISRFMNMVRSPSKSKGMKTKMQKEWSMRNQMNLNMGVSTPHLDRR